MQEMGSSPTLPRVLGRYQLVRRIGRGGMGEVWLAEDPRLRRQVAIKMLPPHNRSDQEYSIRFEREAQAAAALSHPHILPVHDYGEQTLDDGRVVTFIVMPYIGGGALSDRINNLAARQQGMPPQEALTYLTQAAEAIDYAHGQRVIHRDVKPANMLLRDDGGLLLADFGIARMMTSDERVTQAGVGVGTPEYMAPEQARGHAVGASDNYSLAVIAYQMFCGRPPFSAETSFATTILHLTAQPPSPRQFNPTLPEATEQVLLRGLAKTPVERYPSAITFVNELKRSLGGSSRSLGGEVALVDTPPIGSQETLVPAPSLPPVTPPEDPRRRRLLIGGAVALAAVGGAGALAYVYRGALSGLALQATATIPPSDSTRPVSTPDPDGPTMLLRAHNKPVTYLTWSTKTDMLYSVSSDRALRWWDINTLAKGGKRLYEQSSSIEMESTLADYMAWSPDGQMLAISRARYTTAGNDTSLIDVYKTDLSGLVENLKNGLVVPQSSVAALDWYQGKYIIAGWVIINDKDSSIGVGLWDPKQPDFKFETLVLNKKSLGRDFSSLANPLQVSPDGTRLAICMDDGVQTGKIAIEGSKLTWIQDQKSPFQYDKNKSYGNETVAAAWSSDGKFLLTMIETGTQGTLRRWEPETAAFVDFQIPSTAAGIPFLALNPAAGKKLLAGADREQGVVYLWDTQSGKSVRTLNSGMKAEPTGLGWSPDGQWLAASFKEVNDTIAVWKV